MILSEQERLTAEQVVLRLNTTFNLSLTTKDTMQ
jgi:hypothetical protein